MPSCLLFYGPGAHQAAIADAARVGRLLADVGGEDLRVDEVRDAVELLQQAPVGDRIGVVVFGPLDDATPKAADALLKPIEDFNDRLVQPILWADDLGTVPDTIRSRCQARWVSNPGEPTPEEVALRQAAADIVSAHLSGSVWRMPGLVKPHSKHLFALLRGIADAIHENPDTRALALWPAIRAVSSHRNPSDIEVISALLGDT